MAHGGSGGWVVCFGVVGSVVRFRVVGLRGVGGRVTVVWLAFGAPSDWEGGIRWLRHGLVLGCLGLFTLSARLMFPATREDASDPTSD